MKSFKTYLRVFRALSPLLVFLILYLATSLILNDFYKVPITVAFLASSIYALAITPGKLSDNLKVFSKGAGDNNLLLMLWIFIMAGAFAACAKDMGGIEATVNTALRWLPSNILLPGLFVASCFISLAIGSSTGTVAALVPIAWGLSGEINADPAMTVGLVVGGAYFGDNLSFISDTTIVATQTQGCKMSDKFRENIKIVGMVAIIMLVAYYIIGKDVKGMNDVPQVDFIRVLPYLIVIASAVAGMNVVIVLMVGIALTGVIGISQGSFDIWQWLASIQRGISSMSDLIIMTLLAGGMLAIIKHNGGVNYLIKAMSLKVSGKRGGEFCIAFMTVIVNMCTANNTVALITVGPIAKDISDKYGISPKRSASILDTMSCFTQGLLPYGIQTLMAVQLTSNILTPIDVVSHLYYPMLIGLAVMISIIIGSKKKTKADK
ncbi:MAG: Na+/H+ antiporter NhaC family protein [Bacteroidaceae bacterium]|nr:Na+/H+ antiporter NhaC family protein [Bacteroidaceae bacterium]